MSDDLPPVMPEEAEPVVPEEAEPVVPEEAEPMEPEDTEEEVTEVTAKPERTGDPWSFGVAVLLLVAMVAFAWQGTHDDKSWTSMVSEIQAFLGEEEGEED